MLCLAEIVNIVFLIVSERLFKLLKDGDSSGFSDLWPYYVVTLSISSALTSLAHWIFAKQYLEVVLLLPLLLKHGQADI